MRVLFVTNLINTGGVAKVVLSYIEGCFEESKDFQCDLVAYEKPNQDVRNMLKRHGVNCFCLPRPTRHFLLYTKQLKEIITKTKYDAIHTHIEFFNWIPCKMAKKNKINITVGHAHGQKGNSNSPLYHLIEAYGRRNNTKYCDVRLACSKPSGCYVFRKDYVLIPNFVDTNKIRSIDDIQIEKYDKEFGINNKSNIVFGYMGYLGLQKNPSLAIEVIKRIHAIEPGAVLLMAGDGVEKEELKKYIEDNNMSEYAFMIGQRTDNLLLMQYFDYLLMPSFSEGMSIALLEAQVSGTPCIVSPGVPSNNDLHMGLYYQANSFSSEDFLVSYKKAQLNQNDSSLEERIEILHQYHNDKESVISKLLSIYRGEIIENKIE